MGLAGSPEVAPVFVVTAAQEMSIRPSAGLVAATALGAEGVFVFAGVAESGSELTLSLLAGSVAETTT